MQINPGTPRCFMVGIITVTVVATICTIQLFLASNIIYCIFFVLCLCDICFFCIFYNKSDYKNGRPAGSFYFPLKSL
ncbi:hypothetical protein XELAEV_18005323mg [Xenopus laevis]|uniref:Uncharacterized protein n=1 Tax=Xenopus laevis TaxID=8355 RepID=A0A974I390_XENLA|nr:hypothetical protein XELAEV_18005323mg [Xenopus laevis]